MMTPETEARREIVAAVRLELTRLFGELQAAFVLPPERVREVANEQVAIYQRRQVNSNQPVLDDPTAMEEAVLSDLVGLGVLDPLLRDPNTEEIIINGPKEVGVIVRGRLVLRPDIAFENDDEVKEIIRRALVPVGRRLDEQSPMVDARLPDGSRLNAVIPPITEQYTAVTIRKFRPGIDTLDRMVELGSFPASLADMFRRAVVARVNFLLCGGTAAGKTTLVNGLGNEIQGANERIVIIEETRELRLPRILPNCQSLQVRLPNTDGAGEITQRDLVRNALRMRPSRIILGECRSGETFDMLRALNTGHAGSFCTVHANSPRDGLEALITMGMMSPERPDAALLTRLITRAFGLIVFMVEEPYTGRRLVNQVLEVTGLEAGAVIKTQDLWTRDPVSGELRWTGTPPSFLPGYRVDDTSRESAA